MSDPVVRARELAADPYLPTDARQMLLILCDIIDELRARDEGWKVHTVGMEELNARLTTTLGALVDAATASEERLNAIEKLDGDLLPNLAPYVCEFIEGLVPPLEAATALLAEVSVTPETQ